MAQAAPNPRMHGLTHVIGGSDPIPFFPSSFSSYHDMIAANPALWAYWPLDDPGGYSFHEEVNGWNMTGADDPAYPFSYGLPGPIVDDAATSIGFTGKDGTGLASSGTRASAVLAGEPGYIFAGGPFTVECWFYPYTPLVVDAVGNVSLNGMIWNVGDGSGYQIALYFNLGTLHLQCGSTSNFVVSSAAPVINGWNYAAATFDGAAYKLWLNGAVTGTQAGTGVGGSQFMVGRDTQSGSFSSIFFEGRIAQVALYDAVLDDATISQHSAGTGVGDSPADGTAGWVPTSDGAGGASLQPPGIEITHGDGVPDETPVAGPPASSFVGTPVNGAGWHLNAHTETAVLYDSSPGRFDVPSMKWTRVPFNTVRIWRTWETTVNGPLKSAWLPEDRGLTVAARDGLLLIAAGMVNTPGHQQTVEGYYSLEYPIVDYAKLPDDDVPVPHGPIVGFDDYYRGARMFHPQSGAVMRTTPGATQRALIGWQFPNEGDAGIDSGFTSDNPFPLYPANWGSWVRPLHLPAPYPALTPADSKSYYVIHATGYPPFGEVLPLTAHADLAAGATVCLQAWQDTPYTLSFSTDHFANYSPFNVNPPWGKRPYLSISYLYDPNDINHTTGKRNPGS